MKRYLVTIIFRTIKNTKINIDLEETTYTIKKIKELIEEQYGFDSKKLKISYNKYDTNCLDDNDKINVREYKKKNTYYIRNYKYIPIKIYDDEKDDDDDIDFDINKFVKVVENKSDKSDSSASVSNPNIQGIYNSHEEKKEDEKIDEYNFPIGPGKKIKKDDIKNKNIQNDNNNPKTDGINVNSKIKKGEGNHAPTMKSGVVGGEIKPEPTKEPEKKTSFDKSKISEEYKKKIEELIDFLGCSEDKALKALKESNGDINVASNILLNDM